MLDDRIRSRILDDHKKLTADGKLPSRSQLEGYYQTFRNRFGPEVLVRLDGEELLETMHALGTKDSLVYWLEFKNDDEFASSHFGSIAGGSAFKFGVFRRKETGNWVTTDEGNNSLDISVEAAVLIARKHRDQLLRGVDHLRQVPPNGDDATYRRVQEHLDTDARDVSNLAWGHKYFSLIYPEKLDDYHNPDYQRFHLVKMLQLPPQGEGRYLCAGRYVAAAHELSISLNHLTTILNHHNSAPHSYWRVGTSDGDKPRNQWPLMREGPCVAIGWPDLGDLAGYEKSAPSKEKLVGLLGERYPGSPQQVGRSASQILNFVSGVVWGDVVLACDGSTVLGIGRVTGGYWHKPGSDFPHRRSVDWLSLDEWEMPEPEGLRTTVHRLKRFPINLVEAERQRLERPVIGRRSNATSISAGSGSITRLSGVPGRIQSVLERKGQVILYGPPGTGKTHWAERTALELASFSLAGKRFDLLTEYEKAVVIGGPEALGTVRTCCFHPAYGYEDFIEGYRPELHEGRMNFLLRDGIFKQLCRDAEMHPQRQFYIVIDEINRGDIPRIFGELLMIIEKDKRGKAVILPLSRSAFRVPPNVFVIGTMNTADRSIALVDTALRRRFGFVELMPDSSLLENATVVDIPLGPWLEDLNRRICEHVGRDARNLQVGHSFLLEAGKPIKDAARFFQVIHDEIIPLLEEYCYEDYDAIHAILGSGLVDLPNRAIRHDLFKEPAGPELVEALLAQCPDLLTSLKAATTPGSGEGEIEPDDSEDLPDRGATR
jgi:5-methylcytosine-specific restriction protein B